MAWPDGSQERAVEAFYSHGAEHFGDFHAGYLNFGLWEEGIADYRAAAENLVHRIGTMLGLDGTSHVLDLAPGMGPQDVYLHDHFGGPQIDAVDATWKHVEHARRRIEERGMADRVRIHHGSATELKFADATFSHVMSIEGPEHFRTRARFFDEALRVLRPGGVMALSDYTLKRPLRTAWERLLLGAACRLWQVPTENVWTTDEYRERLAKSGFTRCDVQSMGTLVIPGYYAEQRRPEVRRQLARIRGFVGGRLGQVIDHVCIHLYRIGLLDYVLVRAEKAAPSLGEAA